MKLLGITAEYNPFHNGHAYHIREAKARTGCDSVIALMSGDFVQRGTPALVSKYTRAEAALRNGADIVIELPVFRATASAERFAEGAVRAFNALGVDAVSYGVECEGS
ncbi:MAG: nucleotidyltransferase family protein, partial [Lachnospiraceae bacterium]|nr:nucleotidyltransferase family protein [Lachnospiraceae bacterium]